MILKEIIDLFVKKIRNLFNSLYTHSYFTFHKFDEYDIKTLLIRIKINIKITFKKVSFHESRLIFLIRVLRMLNKVNATFILF